MKETINPGLPLKLRFSFKPWFTYMVILNGDIINTNYYLQLAERRESCF